MSCENLSNLRSYCRMTVVAASMHHTGIFRTERKIIILCDGQRIQFTPKHHCVSRLVSFKDPYDACPRDSPDRNIQFL